MIYGANGDPIVSDDTAEEKIRVVSEDEARRLDYSRLTAVRDGADYDPDTEYVEAAQPRAGKPFDFSAEKDPDGKPFEVRAQLFEVSRDGQSYRLNRYRSKSELVTALREAEAKWQTLRSVNVQPPSRLREAETFTREAAIERAAQEAYEAKLREGGLVTGYGFDSGDYPSNVGYGNDGQSWGNTSYGNGTEVGAEYIPLMAGPWAKQLYQYQYLDMHRKAFEAYNHNPVARRLVRMTTDFILGRGIDHVATNNEVDEVWREFCERTDFYHDLANIHNDMAWSGEMMMEFYDDDPFKGATDYRMIDPSTVLEIVTDPEDIQKVYYYHQMYSTAMQQYTTGNIPSTEYIIRQIPESKVLHVKLNVSKYEKRGRSDLFSVLGWVKRLKDLMNARVIKGQLEAAFVWDVELSSGDAAVASTALKLPDPYKAGSTWVHNKAVQLKPVTGGLKGNEQAPDVSALLNIIALGGQVPKELIGETQRSGRSGALLASEPGTKFFESRQYLVEHRICHKVADRVLQNAIKAKILKVDDILKDARSVRRLGTKQTFALSREDMENEIQANRDEAQSKIDDQQQFNNKTALLQMKQSHELALNDQKNQHRQALAAAKNTQTTHKITTTNSNVKESLRGVMRESDGEDANNPLDDDNTPLTPEQKARIETIKKTGKFSKELLEFMFPSIAQEDRSAKLKDLALCESMEWLAKETSATLAAKELNITTYSFGEERARIQSESEQGMSIAHVFGQDNKHVPETALAQDVQERDAAKQPAAESFQNVPVPPAVSGMKQVPSGGPGGPGGPGDKPNSGDGKTNKFSAPEGPEPSAKSHGYSAAANHPMTSEGKAKAIKSERKGLRASIRNEVRDEILREALGPLISRQITLAQYITQRTKETADVEDSGS